MSLPTRLSLAWKAARQLGLEQVSLYAAYHAGIILGWWRMLTPARPTAGPARFVPLFQPEAMQSKYRAFFDPYPAQAEEIIQGADEVVAGKVRLFGGPPVPLELVPAGLLRHWTEYETGKASWGSDPDVKMVWEPARFGWAFALARAYFLTGNNGYAQTFWWYTETFLDANPVNLGPNWMSAQEVALRLIALGYALSAFADSPETTPERRARLAQALADHAGRISPTLLYARSQNNNHLVTEAAGLYTAAALLPDHPHSPRWRALGWRWLNRALQAQIRPDGTYMQHSANYHRLMLQAALWTRAVARTQGHGFPPATLVRLSAAARWLQALIDPISGQAPNLGSNDGAYILPLATGGFGDYRPVVQAAARAFLDAPVLEPGPWDEMATGLDFDPAPSDGHTPPVEPPSKANRPISTLTGQTSWASLRAVRFQERPAHGDQLHVDLWWRGTNIARDAGTFRYTAPSPWNNALAGTAVHNTVLIDHQDQMRRAGRFLWVDWAQARWLKSGESLLEAEHDGYTHIGVIHRRRLENVGEDCWRVTDQILPVSQRTGTHTAWLHWLLPDWPWTLDGTTLSLQGPAGMVRLVVSFPGVPSTISSIVQLVRGGQKLAGTGESLPTLGWYSPTYNAITPALSFRVRLEGQLPLTLQSEFRLLPRQVLPAT